MSLSKASCPGPVAEKVAPPRLAQLKTGGFRLFEFTVHPRRNTIENGWKVVRIEPKIMDVLTLLAASAGEVILRDELIAAIWGATPGNDERLTRAISQIRKALQDNPKKPSILETVPKRGYRLLCPLNSLKLFDDGQAVDSSYFQLSKG